MIFEFILALVTFPFNFLYRIKWILTYLAIRLHSSFLKRRFDLYDFTASNDPVKLACLVPPLEKKLESPFSDSHLQEAADEVLIYGVNSKSECLLVRIARGCDQVAEAWLYLKLENGKTYHLVENVGFQEAYEEKGAVFSCGKLQMHYLAPMRRWRILFCGMLKEESQNKGGADEMVFVKFVFLWKASSDVYDLTLDTNPREFANSVAQASWKSPIPPINQVQESLDFYAQTGFLSGSVSVNESPEYEMYLFGEKMRSMGKGSNIAGCKFKNILGNTPRDGFVFHLGIASAPHLFHNFPYGFTVSSSGKLLIAKEVAIDVDQFKIAKSYNNISVKFSTVGQSEFSGRIVGEPMLFYSGQGWNGFMEICFIEFQIGKNVGNGLLMTGEVYKEPLIPKRLIPPVILPKTTPFVAKFSDEICQFEEVSGGKGGSLGKLTVLSVKDKTFTVPRGVVVTTAAYKEFVTLEILDAVKNLEDVVYGKIEGDVKTACDRVSGVVTKTLIPDKVCHAIIHNLKATFGESLNDFKFAVRSSATGEDSAQMSAAGQMDTFLGVHGIKEVFNAIKKCWASQFGPIATEYKRRNGQILNSPMAVVIQEMVACEVAGVLFTCDPVNNNPSVITITANYGLGETVVSGSVEPDTIMLHRSSTDHLEIKSINVGTKHQRIVMQDSGGTVTEDMPEDSKNRSCVSEDCAKELANLSIKIEKFYKSPRDIEWGISNGKIYILQSRPVTSGAGMTDFEIFHEFDAPLRNELEFNTVANVGEVMPGATSPLGLEVILKYFRIFFGRSSAEKGVKDMFLQSVYYTTGLLPFYNHIMIGVAEMINRWGGPDSNMGKGGMMSIFGRFLDDPELLEVARDRFRQIPQKTLFQHIQFFSNMFFHDFGLEETKQMLEDYDVNFEVHKSPKKLFTKIMESADHFIKPLYYHVDSTECSSNWNSYLLSILIRAKGGFDTEVYTDFARLLASSSSTDDVESADVPRALQNLAQDIGKFTDANTFKSLEVKDALKWLQETPTPAGASFKQFLKRHGHRCLKEFDVHAVTWEMNPNLLIKVLQNLCTTTKPVEEKKEEDYSTLFSELNVPLNFLSKCLIRFVLPNCKKAIRGREAGKALSIKSFSIWRKFYLHLSKLMVSEGYIPDTDLIFFFTMDEINEVLDTRSPQIISRATSRRKLFKKLDDLKFPEITKGIPLPVNLYDEHDAYEYVADLTMTGIPVSQGVARGFARVALTIEEASHLKAGEILITYSTDIGWSPYFPIVSGVVTELGGLISHGAVVSREYGLPCVVGLHGATTKFRTGDFVLLDGKKGILQKLPQPE